MKWLSATLLKLQQYLVTVCPSLQTVVHHQNAVCISTDISTVFAECVTGEVRFVDLSNNTEEDSRQGTIQICVNNVWGSVCSDNLLDDIDAQIFCDQLPGFRANGRLSISVSAED